MQTPLSAPTGARIRASRKSTDWRCSSCDKLLGRVDGARIHLRFRRGQEYRVTAPAVATCQRCGTINEIV